MDTRTANSINETPETTRVVVVNYTCMAITILVLVTRFGLANLKWKRPFGLDDIFLSLALMSGMVTSALTEHAVRRGLGTHIRPGASAQLRWLSQLVYVSDLIFLITMFFAKMSSVRLVYRISSTSAIAKGKLLFLQIAIGLWLCFSLPAIAFQCGVDFPWLYTPQRCASSGALWYPTLIFSILTDLWLAISPWSALPDMHVTQKQRQTILGLFSSRIVACIIGVIQVALLAPALHSIDQPQAMPNPTVFKQLVMNTSIITAAIPVLYKALGTYSRPAQAVIYTSQEREQVTTPLEELKFPQSAALPNPKKFDNFAKESGVSSGNATPRITLGDDKNDFSGRFSLAFNKEIEIATSKV